MEGSDVLARCRQQRSRDSLARIIVAAVTLFSEQGFEATRVSDIAAGACTPIGTVYQHFTDKEAMLNAIVAGYRACRMREIAALCASPQARDASPAALIRLHLNIVFSAFTLDAGLLRLIERRRLENAQVHEDQSRANDIVANLIADRLVEKLPERDSAVVRLQVHYVHSIIRGAVVWSVLPSGGELGEGLKVTDTRFAEEALAMSLRYLRIAE